MSMLYSDRNQPDKEKALLTKQLAITPKDSVTNYLLADLIIRGGVQPGQPAFQEAKGYLATSLATKPDSAEAQVLMGHLLEQENNISDAVGHYGKAIELEPDNRSALDRQFILLRRLHRNDEAAQTLQHLKSVLNNEIEQERKSFPARTSAAPQGQP
ncbi:tetratricopeptide (TPR) repeat protein [Edaphobacter lichenicola]|uniref:Tetratricopeptide (TPR) repeat protein n=2 Tax=Tunturiibacter TaxID=3154218 RepID=A0A7W8JBI1_9BACT|nr:tetratricopeptide (TPR) repeat protein [Edaphobacter lichenicola]